jgi:hypothetical protein
MTKGAHRAIDSKISRNNLNPKNIKNQVNSETIDMYGLLEDYMFNQGTAIFNAQTKGGDNRFYKRNFSMPSTYGLDDNEPYSTKDQIMQLLSNSIRQSPDDTTSTKEIKDLYKLHKTPMPKYKKGGKVGKTLDDFLKYEKERKRQVSEEDKAKYEAMNLGEWMKHVGMPEDESIFSDYKGMYQEEGERWEKRNYERIHGYDDDDYIYEGEEEFTDKELDSFFRNFAGGVLGDKVYPGEGVMLEKYLSGHNPNPGGVGSVQKSFQIQELPEMLKLPRGYRKPK